MADGKKNKPNARVTAGLLLRAYDAKSALEHARRVVEYLEKVIEEERESARSHLRLVK